LLALGTDLFKVWQAPTTAPRDKKELLRTLIEEVIITLDKEQRRLHLTLRWRGGTLIEIDLTLQRRPAAVRTDEDTVALVRRLERFAIRLTMARTSEMSNGYADKEYLCAPRNHSIQPFRKTL